MTRSMQRRVPGGVGEARVFLRERSRSRAGTSGRSSRGVSRSLGFTLIEVVLATLLLALGLAIAFATLRTAGGTVERADAVAARNEHLRAVQALLYRTLQGAQPIVLARQGTTQQAIWFEGKPDRLRLVASMPGYMSRGGPYIVTLQFVPAADGKGSRLQYAFAMLVDEKPLEADSRRPPEDLLDGIAQAHFEYRGLQSDGSAGPWRSQWTRVAQLPLQVRIVLRLADASRPWPPFMAALPLGYAQARADDDSLPGGGRP